MYAKIFLLLAPLAAAAAPPAPACTTCPGGAYAAAARDVAGFAPATSYCMSKYPLPPKTSTCTSTKTTTKTVKTNTQTKTAATVTKPVTAPATTTTTTVTVTATATTTATAQATTVTTTTPTVTTSSTQTDTETVTATGATVTVDYTAPVGKRDPAYPTVNPKAAAYSSLIKKPTSFVKTACACIQTQQTVKITATVTKTASVTASAQATATVTVPSTITPTSTATVTVTSTVTATVSTTSTITNTVTDVPVTTTVPVTTSTQTTTTVAATETCSAATPNYCPNNGGCKAAGALNDRGNCGRCGVSCTGDDSCINGICKQPNPCSTTDVFCSSDESSCVCYQTTSGNGVCYENGGACGLRPCQSSQQCPNGETCIAEGTNCCTTSGGTALCPAPGSTKRMFRRGNALAPLRVPYRTPASA